MYYIGSYIKTVVGYMVMMDMRHDDEAQHAREVLTTTTSYMYICTVAI
jgi:hypothetical protein